MNEVMSNAGRGIITVDLDHVVRCEFCSCSQDVTNLSIHDDDYDSYRYHHHRHFSLMDDEDYSDLTDIESDDDHPKKKTKNSGPKERGGYRIKKALKVPRATTYTAQALYGVFSRYYGLLLSKKNFRSDT